MFTRKWRWLVLSALVLGSMSSSAAGTDRLQFGALAGISRFERDLTRDNAPLEPTIGLRGGYILTPRLAWFIDAIDATTDTAGNGDAAVFTARTGVEFVFQPGRNRRWFIGCGGGHIRIDFDQGDNYNNWIYSASAGQKIQLGRARNVSLQWEVRGDSAVSRGGWDSTINDSKFLVGVVWGAPVAGVTP
jgi:hypothetical protein